MEEQLLDQIDETRVEGAYSSDQIVDQPVQLDQQDVGVKELIIGADITDEDRNLLYQRLGRPDTHENYNLDDIVPETYNKGLIEDFKKKAYENGMSNDGVRKMAEWYKEVEIKQVEAIEKAKLVQADQHMLELKRDFGVRFDEEIGNARKALDAYTDKAFRQYMDESGMGNHPALVKAFAKIGRELSEDRLVQSETATRLAKNDDIKKSEILRLRSDKAFMDKYRRGDAAAVQRLNRLYMEE